MASNANSPAPVMGMWDQIKSYPRTFWFANVMEMIERWAYYGVRTVLALYIVGAAATGGLEFNHIQKGDIYLYWAIIASFLPMFTGGLADRYGYKKMVAIAVGVKCVGYVMMATQHTYGGFFLGCMLLATGTGLFKPGVQGLIAHSVNSRTASLGWGIFYELVNFGAFLGPILATPLRHHSWAALFYFNAALVAVNFLTLLMFKEPEVARPPKYKSAIEGVQDFFAIVGHSIANIFKPRLLTFILLSAGFWFSFNQLFDLLPNFIDDWVNPATVPAYFMADGKVAPEAMLNMNSLMILLVMVPVAYVASKFKPLMAICLGIFASIVGIMLSGSTMNGVLIIAGILVFTVGEMLSSPRSKDYMASIAPAGMVGLYLGYSEVPNGIGWAIGSSVAGHLYEDHGDKVNFARRFLEQHGMTAEAVKALPKDKVMDTLAATSHQTVQQATEMLWNLNHPEHVWWIFAAIGTTSLVGTLIYNSVIEKIDARKGTLDKVVPQAEGAETPFVH